MSLAIHNSSPTNRFAKKQQGFSLVEVLVSLLMIAIGLVSITYLQTSSVNKTMAAYNETQSTLYLQEMVELLRANKAAAGNGEYNIALSQFSDLTGEGTSLAEIDRHNWFNNLNNTLPGAKAAISCTASFHCVLELGQASSEAEYRQTLAVIL